MKKPRWVSLSVGFWAVSAVTATLTTVQAKPLVVNRKSSVAVRPRPVTAIPREDGRPAREDRGRAETRLLAARGEYLDGNYADAVMSSVRILAETQPSLDQQVQVFELLAACYVALGQLELAVRSFGEVLHRRPDFALDPVKTSPKIRSALETARTRL